MPLTQRGRCHVFGDDIPLDEGLIPFDMAIRRIDDPALLNPELFKQIDPGFAARVQPGDIVIAGANFCCGKPHLQGFISMASQRLSVVCVSMPYKPLRGAISKGVPVLEALEAPAGAFTTGDEIEVDFATGLIVNLSRGGRHHAAPLSSDLIDIVQQGGTRGVLTQWLAAHPELGEASPP